ncbi:MAG: helix-turn-helix transcriptional regulator [Treponema sp.]|nr:helix-turn-helix transcriptional regulator [Treponema sp.]
MAADIPAPGVNEVKPAYVGNYMKFIEVLSRRELEVVEAVLAGSYSYKELSTVLNVSGNTVKAHLKSIYKKTGVSNINALTALFRGYKPLQ